MSTRGNVPASERRALAEACETIYRKRGSLLACARLFNVEPRAFNKWRFMEAWPPESMRRMITRMAVEASEMPDARNRRQRGGKMHIREVLNGPPGTEEFCWGDGAHSWRAEIADDGTLRVFMESDRKCEMDDAALAHFRQMMDSGFVTAIYKASKMLERLRSATAARMAAAVRKLEAGA